MLDTRFACRLIRRQYTGGLLGSCEIDKQLARRLYQLTRLQWSRDSSTMQVASNPSKRDQSRVTGSSSCLSIMPTSMLLRTLTVTTFLSFPRLVGLCLPAMERLSRTQAWLICPDKNPFLKSLIKVAFYNNFAAGENEAQVQQAVARLKAMGCYGVILGYARETMAEHADCNRTPDDNLTRKQIEQWKAGNLRTVGMVSETDFVGIK